MMLELDSSTVANMTAALDHACKVLADLDTTENRKRIGNALISAAKSGKRSLHQLIEVANQEIDAICYKPNASVVDAILKTLGGRLYRAVP